MPTLLLWDIDHTLVEVGSLGREVYATAFEEVAGRPLDRLPEMSGRTDRAIMAETLQLHGIEPTPALEARFADALTAAFAARGDDLEARGRALPGARAALTACGRLSDVVQSVLTGNVRATAEQKLTAFDLHCLVDLDVGAYGMDDLQRPPLVGLARARAGRKYGRVFDHTNTVLVGDTPRDVHAGRAAGAHMVAVATGRTSREELAAAGADLVLCDLSDTRAVIDALGLSRP